MSETKSPPTSAKAPSASAINVFFIFFVCGAIIFAAWTGRLKEVTEASFESAKSAVTLAVGLVGIMALWLGLVKVLEDGGFMRVVARAVRPVMVKLFPDVPGDHPAMGAMIMNLSANVLGLGNAATPMGIKAMVELNKLNPLPGTATNAMCLFLAINTSGVAVLPLGVIGVRAAAGCQHPAAIFIPTLIATTCSTISAVCVALFFAKRSRLNAPIIQAGASEVVGLETAATPEAEEDILKSQDAVPVERDRSLLIMSFALGALFLGGVLYQAYKSGDSILLSSTNFISHGLMPALMLFIILYGLSSKVRIYESVTEGAKQGFDVAIRIIPFLVAILVAVGMFRASGAMTLLVGPIGYVSTWFGLPAEVVPMALIRPLSGTGAFAMMSEIISRAPDSYEAFVASTVMGSTETTFYVLAVYFGAVGVTKVRYALIAGLVADCAGVLAAGLVSLWWFNNM